MTIEIAVNPERLNIWLAGTFSLAEAKKCCQLIIQSVVEHQSTRVLIDGRNITGKPTVMERYLYGEFKALTVANSSNRSIALSARYAYVLMPPVRDPNRFGETVAVNRGLILKTFESVEEAQQWLELS
jgi:hypothetical protein